MSSFSRQVVCNSTSMSLTTKRLFLRSLKLKRHQLYCRAEKGTRSEPLRPNPRFTSKDVDRILADGPKYEDLTQQHTVTKKGSFGKTLTEEVEFIRPETLGKEDPYIQEPCWCNLKEITYMEFYKGVEERNWRSEYFNPESKPWKIFFYEDSGRLGRPSFPGYRALIVEQDSPPVWCNMPMPGGSPYEEDYLIPKEVDGVNPTMRNASFEHPADYGYLQLFHRLGMSYQPSIPVTKKSLQRLKQRGFISVEDGEKLKSPSMNLLETSFHLTKSEPSFHGLWYTLPRLAFIVFAFSFLGICLFIGIFKPKKQMPADAMQAMEFAQSKGRARKDGRTGVKFTDIAGLESIIDDLKDIVEFLKEPTKFKSLHAKPPKGILIEGPPGTGKTLIAKALAGEAGVPFFQMSGSEFVEAIVGVGAARIRDLFKRARAQDEACIIFVDEIDALGAKRSEAGISTNEEREQTLNQLLTEMDGFSSEMGVVFVGATNRADLLDPALQRPGRFDRKLRILKPATEGRYQILLTHARKHKISPEVDLMQLARDLPGLAGAQLSSVLNEAALEAIRRDAHEINTTDVYNGVDRVIHGLKHPIQPADMSNGRVFAVHEMGRAIVSIVLRERTGHLEAVEKLSIVARGREETRTVFYRGKDEDYTMTTKRRMFERICVILAGRAAEEHSFKYATTYGCKDLGSAFRLSQKMVAHYGLSDLGLTSFAPYVKEASPERNSFEVKVDKIDEDLYGRGLKGASFQSSDANFNKMLTKCYEIVCQAYEETLEIITMFSNALEAGSEILLEKRELSGDEVAKLVDQYPPKPIQKRVRRGEKWETFVPLEPSPLSINTIEHDEEESLEKEQQATNLSKQEVAISQ